MVASFSVDDGTHQGPPRAEVRYDGSLDPEAFRTLSAATRPGKQRPTPGLSRTQPVLGPVPPWLDCANPLFHVPDPDSGQRPRYLRCKRKRHSQCPGCSARYRGRVRRFFNDGLHHWSTQGLHVGLLTLTAPGENEHRGVNRFGPRPEGICPCTRALDPADPLQWNATAGRRWNRLATAIRRRYPDFQFGKATEFQLRGLIHFHVAVPYAEPFDLQWIRAQALRAGFGCSTDFRPDCSPSYLAKYVTKSLDQAQDFMPPRVGLDKRTGDLDARLPIRLRTRSASKNYPVTMAQIEAQARSDAHAYALSLRSGDQPATGAEQPEAGAPTVGETHPPNPPL